MITLETLQQICPQTRDYRLVDHIDPLNAACSEFAIVTAVRRAPFLAQVAHESGAFRYVKEVWGPTPAQERYNTRADLGNTKPEAVEIAKRHGAMPGPFWKGRGLIQITGFDNYCAVRNALNLDCVENPQLLETPVNAARSAGWFWKEHGCNELADAGDFEKITRRINGGLNGYDERCAFWGRARAAA